jgi:hypothetical protein
MKHDAVLYLGQALFQLNPEVYKNDLFFLYGSQDQFSFFSSIYAWVISLFGIGQGAILLFIASQSLFVIALVLCCRRLYGTYVGIWAAIAIAATPRLYGGLSVFMYTEAFLTARSVAEPLCLFGIWLILEGRRGHAFLMLMLAALMHPLIALPCLVLWWVHMIGSDRRWLWMALLLPAFAALGYAGLMPFDKLLDTYDPTWWKLIQEGTRQVIPLEWKWMDWVLVAFDVTLILFAFQFVSRSNTPFFKSLLLTGAICLVLSVIGSSLLHNVLLTSIQIWRVHWILHLFAISVVPFLVLSLWPIGGLARFSAMFVVVSIYLPPYPGAYGTLLMAAALYFMHTKQVELSPFLKRVLWGALVLVIIAKVAPKILLAFPRETVFDDPESAHWKSIASRLIFAFPTYFVWALGFGWLASRGRFRTFAYAALGIIFVVVLAVWDKRTPWQRYLDQPHEETHPFQTYIEEGKEVYWHQDLLAPWILLKAPSYYETNQGAGMAFNRKTATAYQERTKALAALSFQTEICQVTDMLKNADECRPNSDVVKEACETSPTLTAMVFPWRVDGMEGKEWIPPLISTHRQARYYLYECTPFRK